MKVSLVRPDKLKVALFGLLLIIIVATLGYHFIEDGISQIPFIPRL